MAKKRTKTTKNTRIKTSLDRKDLEVNEEDIMDNTKEEVKPDIIKRDDKLESVIKKDSLHKRRKKKILFGTVLVLLIILIILAINMMGLFVRHQSEIEMPLVYTTNGELKFISPRKTSSVSIGKFDTSKVGLIKYPNRSDKYFLFTSNNALYMSYTRIKKDNLKIADDAQYYYFSADDKHIVYIDSNWDLFVSDFKNSYKLDSEIALVIEVTEDRVYYEKNGGLYSKSLKASKDDRIKIADEYSEALMNSDCSKILYAKKTGDDTFEYHVYNIAHKKDNMVLKDVYTVYDYNDDFTEFIYGNLNKNTSIDLNTFIDDDKLDYDNNFKVYTFDDYWNNKIDYDTYKNSQKDGDAVKNRTKLREELKDDAKNKLEGSETIDVYYQKGKKNIRLAESISKINYTNLKDKRLIYSKDDYSSIEKIKLSEVSSLKDIKDHVHTNLKNVVAFKAGTNSPYEITSGKTSVVSKIFGNDLYCQADGDLIYASINKNKLGEVKTIASNSIVLDWENLYDGSLAYLSNKKETSGDLNIAKDGKVKFIDNNVYEDDFYITYNDIYYFKDYKDHQGDYYRFNDKSKRILTDVGHIDYVKDNYMYVLKDYSSKTTHYDLYRYKDKKLELIDKDVNIIELNY